MHFAHDGDEEDLLTISYLRDTAREAGIENVAILMNEIGWDNDHALLRRPRHHAARHALQALSVGNSARRTLRHERALNMASGNKPQKGRTQWIEPIWKMLWSNKALLAILWEMYPDHELLCPRTWTARTAWHATCASRSSAAKARTSLIVNGSRSL